MTETAQPFARLRLAPDLVLTWDRHLLTVATSRWEPGTFLYDLQFLTVECKPDRGRVKIALGGRGAHFQFHVLRFDLDDRSFRAFDDLVARMRTYREEYLS